MIFENHGAALLFEQCVGEYLQGNLTRTMAAEQRLEDCTNKNCFIS